MNITKKILALLLVALVSIGIVTSVAAEELPFTDVSAHWAWTGRQIPYLVDKEVLNGYKQQDGTFQFKPDKAITRAEYIKILTETAGLTEETPVRFTDVKESDWFYPYFCKANAQGFLINYGTYCNPNAEIPREEAVALLVRYLNLSGNPASLAGTFTDYETISSYYRSDVLKAVDAGVINGYAQNNGTYLFKPKQTMTRAEALTVIYRAFGAIYDASKSGRDADANAENSIITASNILISNATLNGRNIISEGAGNGTVTISNSKIDGTLYVRGATNVVLDGTDVGEVVLEGTGTLTFLNKSKVDNLTVENPTTIALQNGSVDKLNVKVHAENVTVTGNGSIEDATIAASGFVSSMVPKSYLIGNNLTAVFAATTYSGSSSTTEIFASAPYMTTDDTYYYLNFESNYGGTMYVYFTNSSVTPTAAEYETIYKNSANATSFTVVSAKPYSQELFAANKVSNYKYAVLQLVSGPSKYAPVVISNTVLTGNGFLTNPALDAEYDDLVYSTESNGTLYWFYTDSGNTLSQAEFLQAYADKENAFKGTQAVVARRSYSLEINLRYANNYPYIAMIVQNPDGLYYKPVVVATGDDGFTTDPRVTAPGKFTFKPSVTGTVLFYLSAEEELPSPADFYTNYRRAAYKGSVDVEKDVESEVTFNTNINTATYPYAIIALRDAHGDYFFPVALYVDYSTGFSIDPYVNSEKVISYRPTTTGTIQYYYTDSATVPSVAGFVKEFSEVTRNFRGTVTVTSTRLASISYDSTIARTYPYIVFLFTSDEGHTFYPYVLKLDNNLAPADSGFVTLPVYSEKDEGAEVSFRVSNDGRVYWFFANNPNNGMTVDEFWNFYMVADEDMSGMISVTARSSSSIPVTTAINEEFDYVVLSAAVLQTDGSLILSTPVIVKLEVSEVTPDDPTPVVTPTNYGFTYSIVGTFIQITPKESGTVYYYYANTTAEFPETDFLISWATANDSARGQINVSAGIPGLLSSNAENRYIVLEFVNSSKKIYDYAIFDMITGELYKKS